MKEKSEFCLSPQTTEFEIADVVELPPLVELQSTAIVTLEVGTT